MKDINSRRKFLIASGVTLGCAMLPGAAAGASNAPPTPPPGDPFPQPPPVPDALGGPGLPKGIKLPSPTSLKDYYRNAYLRPVGTPYASGENAIVGRPKSGPGVD